MGNKETQPHVNIIFMLQRNKNRENVGFKLHDFDLFFARFNILSHPFIRFVRICFISFEFVRFFSISQKKRIIRKLYFSTIPDTHFDHHAGMFF